MAVIREKEKSRTRGDGAKLGRRQTNVTETLESQSPRPYYYIYYSVIYTLYVHDASVFFFFKKKKTPQFISLFELTDYYLIH